MSEDDFTIDKVSWHTSTPGNPETPEQTVARIYAVVDFLQRHGLTKGTLAKSPGDISNDFAIEASDLTERGMVVMRKAYDKWVRKVDKGMAPSDTRLLEKALQDK